MKLKNNNHNRLDEMEMHSHTHFKMNKWTWIKNFILFAIAIYFIAINLTKPEGIIKWTWHYGIWFPISTYVVFWEGRGYFKLYKKLIKGIVDMDTLIGIAVHTIYLYSIIFMFMNLNSKMYTYDAMWESPILLIIVTNSGHALEEKLTKTATKTFEELVKLKNAKANIVINNEIKVVKSKDLKINDIIVVKKGDIVPLDGQIINGASEFNYANITGESKGITLIKNQEVMSGSFNLGDAIKLKITKTYENSTIGIIVNKIQNAIMTKPKIQKVADNILKWFIPAVMTISLLTFLVWLILGSFLPNGINFPWLFEKNSAIKNAIRAGVLVLAIACPCALGIATPLIVTITSTLSMKAGLLINNINTLEAINKVKYFAFDKTGTITVDQLIISKIHGDKKLIGIAKALEQEIKHPIAKAILSLKEKILNVSNIQSIKNKGVSGNYQGNKVEIRSFYDNSNKFNTKNTLIALYINEKPKLIFELENQIRDKVVETIKKIKAKGFIPIMITGDNEYVAKHIANKVGIEKIYFEINPNGKSEIIKKLQKDGGVIFVGDGFNDSIAMKQSELSLAFATGSDITNSLADISIINNHFNSIYNLILIAKMNKRRIRISMTWAILFNIITIPIAIILLVPPWAGATIMSISDILIVANALLYKIKGTKLIKKNQKY